MENALIRYQYSPNEITQLCNQAIESTQKKLDALIQSSKNPLHDFEQICAEFSNQSAALTFMKDVSTEDALRKEAAQCEEKIDQFSIEIFTRKELYLALKNQKNLPSSDQRLWTKTLRNFENNGLNLPDPSREEMKKLSQTLSKLETQFNTNLNEDNSTVEFTQNELEGLPKSFIESLNKSPNGNLIVPVKGPHTTRILDNAVQSKTRKKMLFAYENRASEKNTKLYQQALEIRKKIASLMGYKNWADFRLIDRMAKDSESALNFLNNLKKKLTVRNQADLAKLLKFKKQLDSTATQVDAWDIRYLAYQLMKRDYQLDDEVIRTYFPQEIAVRGMFELYSKLLGVRFIEVKNAKVWAPHVQFFQILDNRSNQIVGYFYTDFIPREGKYGHAAAFTLRSGQQVNSETYLAPVSAIVANFTPPESGKPVLLSHSEVRTLFHEFGHIMHQTLTRAPFSSLSGTKVARDFVEAPSQMLENWVFSPQVLTLISGHYQDPTKKLPTPILQKIVQARDFNLGYFYTRQLVFGLFDMICHTAEKIPDVTQLYHQLHQELVGIPAIEGGHFPATFGHLMGGYDAGYYGYLWSDVYAMDMFTRFEAEGLTNNEVGTRYRRAILEKGNMQEAYDLLKEFLGREPNSNAFFKKLFSDPPKVH
jgi:thimet oligopeptidase